MSTFTASPVTSVRNVARRPPFNLNSVKLLMAITGSGLLTFVAVHMFGSLQIYLGQEALNAYVKKLKDMPAVLWLARSGLIAFLAGRIRQHRRRS